MNAGQKSARRIAARNAQLSCDSVCSSCLNRLSQPSRRHAATAAALADLPAKTKSQHIAPVISTGTAPQKAYALRASAVVSRPPLLTRDLTPFEKSFYLYQKRLNERLALPFTRYFYYKKGTPGDLEWKRKLRVRKTPAKDIGVYAAYADEGWNDEVLMGDKLREPESMRDALVRDAEGRPIIDLPESAEPTEAEEQQVSAVKRDATKLEVERPVSRITEADEKGDLSNLSRKLDRTLYLVVRNKEGTWRFPEDRVYGKENLHQATERLLIQSCGINMNTWIVANHPIGWFQSSYDHLRLSNYEMTTGITMKIPMNPLVPTSKEEEREEFGEKVFFMKTRIMAGQADLSTNIFGLEEYQWLAKEELQGVVAPKYWHAVKNMLVAR